MRSMDSIELKQTTKIKTWEYKDLSSSAKITSKAFFPLSSPLTGSKAIFIFTLIYSFRPEYNLNEERKNKEKNYKRMHLG